MKILFIVQCGNLGGMEKSTLSLMLELIREGIEVEYFSLVPYNGMEQFLSENNIVFENSNYDGWNVYEVYKDISRVYSRFRPDIIFHTGHNLLVTALLPLFRVKKYLSIHFHHKEEGRPTKQWAIYYLLGILVYKRIYFCSNYIRNEAVELLPFLNYRSSVLKNLFVNHEQKQVIKTDNCEDTFIIGSAGWLIDRKIPWKIIELVSFCRKIGLKVTGSIAGDGPLKHSLQQRAKELDVTDHIEFKGWVNDMEKFYASLDLLLFTSKHDALGRSAVECVIEGTPILAFVVNGGLSEVFHDATYSIVHANWEVEAISKIVERLSCDPAYYEAYTTSCMEQVNLYSNRDEVVNSLLDNFYG